MGTATVEIDKINYVIDHDTYRQTPPGPIYCEHSRKPDGAVRIYKKPNNTEFALQVMEVLKGQSVTVDIPASVSFPGGHVHVTHEN